MDGKLVEQDIAARRQEALIGWEFAKAVDRIEAALQSTRSNLAVEQWCKQVIGADISTMRRRKRLYKHWKIYEAKRRALGQCGQTGLLFALSLIQEDAGTRGEQSGIPLPVQSLGGTKAAASRSVPPDIPGCIFLTGDAVIELPKLPAKSVNVVVTSPPYWPAKRSYSGRGIGFEPTLKDYIENLVAVFRETKRVLRDDGTIWILIDDSYDDGNLLFIPARLGMALQEDGWVCRSEIIWSKKGGGRPDSVNNRPVKDIEKLLMLTKQRNGYHYDGDPIRVPLKYPYSVPGRKKPGSFRRDYDRTERVWSNPMGRSSGSVWEAAPSSFQGTHTATMAEDLVRRCLQISCPETGVALDPFGGAGTTALMALRLKCRAISIEISADYTNEARQRISGEFSTARNR